MLEYIYICTMHGIRLGYVKDHMQGIMQEIVRRGKNALILITWDGEAGYIMYICRYIDRWNIDKYIDR